MEPKKLSTASIGRHCELLAEAALIADGWSVSIPAIPEAYDLLAMRGSEILRVQVKKIKQRISSGSSYYVIRGLKNNKQVYTKNDCDVFIGVVDGKVYMTDNRELSEYWCKEDEASTKWTRIPIQIN